MTIHKSGPENAPLAAYHCTTCDNDAFSTHPRLPVADRLLPIVASQATGRELAEGNVAEHESKFPNHRILLLRFWSTEPATRPSS